MAKLWAFLLCVALLPTMVMANPTDKIDKQLLAEMKSQSVQSVGVQQVGVMRAMASKSPEFPIILVSSEGGGGISKPFDELGVFNAVSSKLTYEEIMNLAEQDTTKKIYLDQKAKIDLDVAVPLVNGVTVIDGGKGVRVCVLDTGIDKTHPALKQPFMEYDFANEDSDATDDHNHGTHVAGIVASTNKTYKGVARGVDLMVGKVLFADGTGYISDVAEGIVWCVENGADIITMSLGGGVYTKTCDDDFLAQVANWAVDQGVVVTASAGNQGSAGGGTPGCASKVISVGAALKGSKKLASFSSKTPEVDIISPGQITSTIRGGWATYSGTSMATPMVAGAVALLKDAFPESSTDSIKTALYSTATCYSTTCQYGEGHGFMNIYNACLYMQDGKVPTTASQQQETYVSYQVGRQGAVAVIGIGVGAGIGVSGSYVTGGPTCIYYKTDNYSTWFAATDSSGKYYTSKKGTDYATYNKPGKVLFNTQEGYPVEAQRSNGGYTYYVWYDPVSDYAKRDQAHAWRFYATTTIIPIGESYSSKECGVCNRLFGLKKVFY